MKFLNILYCLVLFSSLAFAQDNLNWLKDSSRSNPEVLKYLNNENKLTYEFKTKVKPKTDALLEEWQHNQPIKSESPWKIIGDSEYTVTQYNGLRQILSRSLKTKKITVLFNISNRANQFDYYHLGGWDLSNDHHKLVITEDLTGTEQYQASIVDLKTQSITTLTHHVEPTVTWSKDDRYVYLIKQEKYSLRPFELIQFDTKQQTITPLFTEKDKKWLLSFYLSSDHRYAMVQSNSSNSTEQRILNLTSTHLSLPIKTRQEGIEYYADIAKNKVIINSNHERHQFILYSADIAHISNINNWLPFYRPQKNKKITDFYLFKSGPVVSVNDNKGSQLIYLNTAGEIRLRTSLSTSGQVAWVSRVGDFNSDTFYLRSMSMVQSPKWEKVNTATLNRALYLEDQYPNIDTSLYATEQIIITTNGIELPVTLAYRKDKLTNTNPVFLYGYGAYGVTMKPYFMPQIISLLDRGVIYAIAHVRGGGYKGEDWHQAGRGINRQNAATDFINAAKSMKLYRDGERQIYALGSSAGGTLIATALNQEPKLFQGATLNVPFVDVINSMSDSSLPLTLQQYSEWGNPTIQDELNIMKKTDPYLNISTQEYPPLLVQVGFNDSRVPYWEGAKYLTKIRRNSSGTGPYLLETHFNQGHSTNRRDALKQQAFEYIFLLSLINN
ncbi:protease [Aliivibrio fischeri]|uniref:prolyl oligopeptidase family serine peptidase n=1 Tax=Aliivibrio fischeri TaxID=668 RepID=UPI0003044452|nr:prolyl oligopeptidase family serine peptidase [Aliivibrio fischeri]OCH26734.1 protease [Aliivibrio fischeri]OEE10868.1 protease [Aliivibrio fischeri ZF-211]